MFDINSTQVTVASAGLTYLGQTIAGMRRLGVPEADLRAGVVAHLHAAIDAEAERLRTAIATPGAGQAMEYLEAQQQAFAAVAGEPAAATAERYPMLAASLGLDVDPETGLPATTILGVARAVTAAYRLWLAAGAAIRAARLQGKAAIAAAGTVEAAVAAAAGVTWPSLPA